MSGLFNAYQHKAQDSAEVEVTSLVNPLCCPRAWQAAYMTWSKHSILFRRIVCPYSYKATTINTHPHPHTHTHTHLSALGKWHHITLEGPILIWDSHYMLMALEWVDCLPAVLQGLTELKFPNCFPSFVPSVGHQSLPGLHSIILRTYFSSWNQTFPIHAIPRFTMTHTVPSDSDFEFPSIPAFSLYQMQ